VFGYDELTSRIECAVTNGPANRSAKHSTHSDVTIPRDSIILNVTKEYDSEGGFDGYVTNRMTVGGEVPVYSDLTPLESMREGIGAWGFEPQTPTVSR
jgi:hypothetical protein